MIISTTEEEAMKNPVNVLKSLNFALNMGELHEYVNFISMTTLYKQKHSIHWCIKIDLGTFLIFLIYV